MHTFLYTQLYLQLPILIIHNAYTNYTYTLTLFILVSSDDDTIFFLHFS